MNLNVPGFSDKIKWFLRKDILVQFYYSVICLLVKMLLPMKKMYILFVVLLAMQIILAIICAPYSCEWGNTVYFYGGLICLAVSFVLPLLQKDRPMPARLGFGFLFLVITAGTWIASFILNDFRIMCRLFWLVRLYFHTNQILHSSCQVSSPGNVFL